MAASKNKTYQVIGEESKEWCFKLNGSEKLWRMPLLGSLPLKTARRLMHSKANDETEMIDAATDLLDEICPGLTDELTVSGLMEVVSAWGEASGILLGESRSSSE